MGAVMNIAFVSSILLCSSRYHEGLLKKYDLIKLRTDYWSALDFFLGRACFQGRRDDMSERVYEAMVEVLSPIFCDKKLTCVYESKTRETIESTLRDQIRKKKVGKGRDVDMVLSALDFINHLPSLNIVSYSVERIQNGEIEKHYNELQRSQNPKGIIQVGPKIASFYLRDVVSLYDLEDKVSEDFAFCLQPIDVWVRKLAHKIGMVGSGATAEEIAQAIVSLCKEQKCSPVQFNQGAWYIGHFAFDLLLEMLTESQL